MGTCLSKKKGSSSSTSSPIAGNKSTSTDPAQAPAELKNAGNGVTLSKSKMETEPEVNLKKKKTVQEKQVSAQEDEGQVKKEILIIKHRKSHDDRERNFKNPHGTAQQNVPLLQPADEQVSSATNEAAALMGNKIVAAEANMGVGVRISSCTKEELDAILIHCGRLSRNSSGKAACSSSAASGERGRRRYSGSKRSDDFDHCENNDTISTDEDQKRANANVNSDLCENVDEMAAEKHHQHRQRHHQSPRRSSSQGRRRSPSREREQSSREKRVSRSPGRRGSSDTNTPADAISANANNNSNTSSSRPGKMVTVPATVPSLVIDKSINGGGGGKSATTRGINRITVKRNVGDSCRGAASPRSKSPARANGNAANAKVLSENHQQPSLSRNSSRKAEKSPYRRNALNEIDPNSIAYPQSTTESTSRVQKKGPKKEVETEDNQKPNVDVNDNGKNRTNSKEQQEVEVKVHSSMADNTVVKTVVQSGVDNLELQTLTRTRSSRRSRDLDLNPEALLVPAAQSYTSLLLDDIHNFHQKNHTPSISLPACVTKACSILEAVADLNSTTPSNFSGAFSEERKNPPTYQSRRNECNVPFVESEVVVSDDVMEPSLHKYVTAYMEDQESSGSNSFAISSGQQHREPNSGDSTDCWTSKSNCQKLNSKRRESDHQHGNGIGRGRLGPNKGLHTLPVVTAAASS